MDFGRFPGRLHAEGRDRRLTRAGPEGCARVRSCSLSPGKISTKTIFPAWAFMDTGSSCCKTTVARPARFSCSCRFCAWPCRRDSPFWTARENEGIWEDLGETHRKRPSSKSRGLCLVNHGKTGTSEIIPGKVYYEDPNYSKLAYNTHFPWEDHDPQGGTAMEYSFRSLDPRDVRGDDINFYLTGLAIQNDASRNCTVHHVAKHALQRRAQGRHLPAGDHAEAAEQRGGLHHRPGRNHHPRRRGAGRSVSPGVRA